MTMGKMCLKSKIEVFLRGAKQQKKAALIDGFFHNVESHIKHYAAPDIDSEITNLKSLSLSFAITSVAGFFDF